MDNFDFDKVKKRTNVDKDTIIDLAKMVNENGLKDEKTLRTVINKLSLMTGKDVSKDLEDKIIDTIKEDKEARLTGTISNAIFPVSRIIN